MMNTLLLLANVSLIVVGAWIVIAVGRAAIRNRNTPQLVKLAEVLADKGWAGYRVELDLNDRKLQLFAPAAAPEGVSFFISTRRGAVHPPELTYFYLDNELDHLLPVVAGSTEAITNLRRNLDRVTLIGPLVRAHGGTVALDVSSDVITVYLRGSFFARGLPIRQLQELLPKVIVALNELLSAVLYPPPEGAVLPSEGPFRGEADASGGKGGMVETMVSELPADGAPPRLVGPLSLEELAKRLKTGRLSWFSRVSTSEQPLQPLAAIDALRPLRDGPRREEPQAPVTIGAAPKEGFLRFAQNPIFFVVALLAFVLPGMSVHCSTEMVVRGRASASWPAAEGVITTSRIKKRRSSGTGNTFFRTMIFYSYEVNGKRYEGDRLRFVADARRDLANQSESFSDRKEADYFLQRYPKGKKVAVYYDPSDPKTAALIKGEVRGQSASIIVGTIISSVGLLYLLLAFIGSLLQTRLRRRFAAQLAETTSQ